MFRPMQFVCVTNYHKGTATAASFVVVLVALLYTFYSSQTSENNVSYNFKTEWYDAMAGQVLKLRLTFFPADNSVELFDLKKKKLFLKRHPIDDLEERDLYVGNSVVIYSRQLKITDYADETTKQQISKKRQKTFAMVKPDGVHRIGEIVQLIYSRGFDIIELKMVHLTQIQAKDFYSEHGGKPFLETLVKYMTSGPVIAMELIGDEAIQHWRKVLGPTDSVVARDQVPDSLRAQFGTDKQENAAHGSDSLEAAQREINFFFPKRSPRPENVISARALFRNNTCCLIKPHAVNEGKTGSILTAIIDEGFQISALQMVRLVRSQAEEFLEIYKEVLNEYPRMVNQLISGPLLALEVTRYEDDDQTPYLFREFVGPMDPEIAKELRPQSLRARFGKNKIENAIHCTDLPEDSPLEVEYFFKFLQ